MYFLATGRPLDNESLTYVEKVFKRFQKILQRSQDCLYVGVVVVVAKV